VDNKIKTTVPTAKMYSQNGKNSPIWPKNIHMFFGNNNDPYKKVG
jgi:hypothetical protein